MFTTLLVSYSFFFFINFNVFVLYLIYLFCLGANETRSMKSSKSTDSFQNQKDPHQLTMNLDSTFAIIKAENYENGLLGLKDCELNAIYKY